jgi:hypothetical protein
MSKQDIETVKATLTPLKKQLQEREDEIKLAYKLKKKEALKTNFKDVPGVKFEERNDEPVAYVDGVTFHCYFSMNHPIFSSTHKELKKRWWGKKYITEIEIDFYRYEVLESVGKILEKHLEALEWEVTNG